MKARNETEHNQWMPLWFVWCPERGESPDDARPFRAIDESDAAEEWAEYEDVQSADYTIVSGDEPVVKVRRDGANVDDYATLQVSGESVPQYSAVEIDA